MARVTVQVPVDQIPNHQQPMPEPGNQQPKKPLFTKNNILIVGGIVLLVVIVVMIVTLMNDRKQLKDEVNKLSTGQTSSNKNNEKYQQEVAKLVEVPEGINPNTSTLTQDAIDQLLKQNPTLTGAKVGDIVLLYTRPDQTFFLVIYRPTAQKIVLATQGSKAVSVPTSTNKP